MVTRGSGNHSSEASLFTEANIRRSLAQLYSERDAIPVIGHDWSLGKFGGLFSHVIGHFYLLRLLEYTLFKSHGLYKHGEGR